MLVDWYESGLGRAVRMTQGACYLESEVGLTEDMWGSFLAGRFRFA
jgi:hypothetical protein